MRRSGLGTDSFVVKIVRGPEFVHSTCAVFLQGFLMIFPLVVTAEHWSPFWEGDEIQYSKGLFRGSRYASYDKALLRPAAKSELDGDKSFSFREAHRCEASAYVVDDNRSAPAV